MLNLPDKPWWETDEYLNEAPIPADIANAAGPKGLALTRAYPSGQTQKGWGTTRRNKDGEIIEDGFMENYMSGQFLERRALYGYDAGKHGFAFVLRSARLLCVDIDGKNGGLAGALTLGNMPYTLSETSKSGTGYHLWYLTDETWDDVTDGFGELPDQIGIVQGVDIRAVGCVYHWPTQRWNDRPIAPLPQWLRDQLIEHREKRLAAAALIQNAVNTDDPEELMMLQAELESELAKPIKAGKRNSSLFAIGNKMKVAQIPNWESQIRTRGADVGLEDDELDQLIKNITRYDV